LKTDLHIHTCYSDGTHSPAEVVEFARVAGVEYMAITDHDTIDGLEEGRKAARNAGIAFANGIEFTTKHKNEQHILGYGFDPDAKPMKDICEKLARMRRERLETLLRYLETPNIKITIEDVLAKSKNDYMGRPLVAKILVERGIATSIKDAFDRFIGTEEYKKIPRVKPEAAEVIKAIMDSGGTAVLAHPFSLRSEGKDLENEVGKLKQLGLGGIECHYGYYSENQTKILLDIAKKLNLIVTGGSDFHGEEPKPGDMIGTGVNGMLKFDDPGQAVTFRVGDDTI